LTKESLRVKVYLIGFKVKTKFQVKYIDLRVARRKIKEEEKTTSEYFYLGSLNLICLLQ